MLTCIYILIPFPPEKTVKNLLRKITPHPGFEPGTSGISGPDVLPPRPLGHSDTSRNNRI